MHRLVLEAGVPALLSIGTVDGDRPDGIVVSGHPRPATGYRSIGATWPSRVGATVAPVGPSPADQRVLNEPATR